MILIDTGPLVALCDGRDSRHEESIMDLQRLARHSFGTCEAVIVEACFHLPYAAQRLRLQVLLDELDVEVVAMTSTRPQREEIFRWLGNYAEHEPDWADACIAVTAGRDATLKVWTYDREFRTTWRRPNGSRIPLALTGRRGSPP